MVGLRRIKTQVVNAFTPIHTSRRSQNLFWAVSSDGIEQPEEYAAKRRFKAARKYMEAGSPEVRHDFQVVMDGYVSKAIKGTHRIMMGHRALAAGNHPGKYEGPVARLLQTILSVGATIGGDWMVHHPVAAPLHLHNAPLQALHNWIRDRFVEKNLEKG